MHLNQKGQNLLELIVVIAVTIIVVTALVFATLSSLRNAQFAQNQSQATKLAQEWIETIKIYRDKDEPIVMLETQQTWNEFLESSISNLGDTYCYFIIKNNQLQFANACIGQLENVSLFGTNSETTEDGIFERYILVSNNGVNQKRFTVVARWKDFSGTHESKLTTILGKQ